MFFKNKESRIALFLLLNLPFVITLIHFLGKLAMLVTNFVNMGSQGLYLTYILLPISILFYIMFMLIFLFSSNEKTICNMNYFLFIADLLIIVYFFFYYSYDFSQVNYYDVLEKI